MIDILNYNEMYNSKNSYINYIFISICFIILLITVVFNNIYYESYYINSGILLEKDKMKVYVNNLDLNKITTNNILKINNKEFAYKTNLISDILFDGNNYSYEVIIESRFDNSINILNNVINFKIPLRKKTILEYILKKVGGI